jgi:hypothetical protein
MVWSLEHWRQGDLINGAVSLRRTSSADQLFQLSNAVHLNVLPMRVLGIQEVMQAGYGLSILHLAVRNILRQPMLELVCKGISCKLPFSCKLLFTDANYHLLMHSGFSPSLLAWCPLELEP